jgi:predicted enzyme related to lactoylglutathione lyase
MVTRIAFTLYPVVDMARARKFYEEGLGLIASSDFVNGQWVEYEPGGMFVLTTMAPARPAADAGGNIAFEVADVVALTESLRGSGVKVLQEVMDTPAFRMSVVLDPEGNAVTLCQQKVPE